MASNWTDCNNSCFVRSVKAQSCLGRTTVPCMFNRTENDHGISNQWHQWPALMMAMKLSMAFNWNERLQKTNVLHLCDRTMAKKISISSAIECLDISQVTILWRCCDRTKCVAVQQSHLPREKTNWGQQQQRFVTVEVQMHPSSDAFPSAMATAVAF